MPLPTTDAQASHQTGGPVYVRNTHTGPTVLSADLNGRDSVEWAGAGDPSGDDVKLVPETVVNTVPFRKALQTGLLRLETEDAVQESILLQNKAWNRRRTENAEQALKHLDKEADQPIVSVSESDSSVSDSGASTFDTSLTTSNPSENEKLLQMATGQTIREQERENMERGRE